MNTENETGNNGNSETRIIDARDNNKDIVSIDTMSTLDFFGLPKEDTSTTFEVKVDGSTINKTVKANFTRVNLKMVYGGTFDKGKTVIPPNQVAIETQVGKFLKSVYDNKVDEESDNALDFDQWKEKLALQRVNIMLMSKARSEASTTAKVKPEDFVKIAGQMEKADKIDDKTLEAMKAMIARIEAKNAPNRNVTT